MSINQWLLTKTRCLHECFGNQTEECPLSFAEKEIEDAHKSGALRTHLFVVASVPSSCRFFQVLCTETLFTPLYSDLFFHLFIYFTVYCWVIFIQETQTTSLTGHTEVKVALGILLHLLPQSCHVVWLCLGMSRILLWLLFSQETLNPAAIYPGEGDTLEGLGEKKVYSNREQYKPALDAPLCLLCILCQAQFQPYLTLYTFIGHLISVEQFNKLFITIICNWPLKA